MQSFAADASIFKSRKLTNPGLEALWEDERYRRQEMGIESEQLSPPGSPPRDRDADFESEVSFIVILKETILTIGLFFEDRMSGIFTLQPVCVAKFGIFLIDLRMFGLPEYVRNGT